VTKPKKKTSKHEQGLSNEQLAEIAVEALRKQAKVGDGELAWYHMSEDRSRILVGSTQGQLAVFGVFGVTDGSAIGAPQPFNMHHLKMMWSGAEGHPTKEETEADEAAHNAWLEKKG
jgi:hypothetical protein